MNTRAIIFQEQNDGWYKGIAVENGGDIECTGRILDFCYQDAGKTEALIDTEHFIGHIGDATSEVAQDTADEAQEEALNRYFIADRLEDIEADRYMLSLDGYDSTSGIMYKDDIMHSQCMDDDYYYFYVQTSDGKWLVRHTHDKAHPERTGMTGFYPLNEAIKRADEAEQQIDSRITVYQDMNQYTQCTNDTDEDFRQALAEGAIEDITPQNTGRLSRKDVISTLVREMETDGYPTADNNINKALTDYISMYVVFVLGGRLYITDFG